MIKPYVEFKNFPDTSTPINAKNLNFIQEMIRNEINRIFNQIGLFEDTFSNTKTYKVDDYVVYNHQLYKCTKEVTDAGEFNQENWTASYFFKMS